MTSRAKSAGAPAIAAFYDEFAKMQAAPVTAAELEAAEPVLSRLGVLSAEVLQAGHGSVISATTIVRVVMGGHGREERAGAQRRRRGVA